MTNEYALFQNGSFVEIRRRQGRPADIPHKKVNWYPVVRDEGSPPSEGLVGDEYVITTEPKKDISKQPRRGGDWLEFKALFTPEEQRILATAAMQNVDVKLFYDDAVGANYANLDSPNVIAGFEFMVVSGLLTKDRKDAILASDFNAAG